jgi:hypothetical protein
MASAQENPQPQPPSTSRPDSGSFGGISATTALDKAASADPAFKLLWVILGIVVVLSIAAASVVNIAFLAFGGLVAVSILFILPLCIVIYRSSQPDASAPVTPAGRQLQVIAFFMAWSSAVLVVVTLVALLFSALIDWPAPIRSSIWPIPAAVAKEHTFVKADLDRINFANVTQLNGDELSKAKATIKDKGVHDYRVKALFVDDWLQSTGVLLESDDKAIRVFIVVGPLSRPFLWCTVAEKDSDYDAIHKLVTPAM